jgi:RimJ/RimL family protein N-acetyltransferase
LVPLIETVRLRLRGHLLSDLEPHAAMLADPVVRHFFGGQPLAREDSWRGLLAARGLWDLLDYGYWAVERKDDGAYLGLVGFADFKRDLVPSIENIPEMGWILASHAHGQGYASEAIAAGLTWADTALPGYDFVAIINRENTPSIKAAEKAGFIEHESTDYRGDSILIFRRPQPA